MVFRKILQSSVAQFELSCTYLAHGHDVQRNVGLTFFIQHLQTFFLFLPHFYVFNVFKFLFKRFYIYGKNRESWPYFHTVFLRYSVAFRNGKVYSTSERVA